MLRLCIFLFLISFPCCYFYVNSPIFSLLSQRCVGEHNPALEIRVGNMWHLCPFNSFLVNVSGFSGRLVCPNASFCSSMFLFYCHYIVLLSLFLSLFLLLLLCLFLFYCYLLAFTSISHPLLKSNCCFYLAHNWHKQSFSINVGNTTHSLVSLLLLLLLLCSVSIYF
jgi:hypothetical protein